MSDGRETVNRFFLFIGAVMLAGLGFFAPWPLWTSVLLVGTLVPGAMLIARTTHRRPKTQPAPHSSSFPSFKEPEPGRRKVVRVPLPSCAEDYNFLFSATVVWSPVGESLYEGTLNAEAVAIQVVVERATRVTEKWAPERVALLQYELSGTLGRIQLDSSGKVRAMAQDISLTLVEDDQKRLETLATRRKEMAVWSQEKQEEQSRLRYLSESILRSPGSTVVWHLDRNGEQVGKTVGDIRQLTHLSLAARDELPEDYGANPLFEESPEDVSSIDHASALLFSAGFADEHQLALFAAELADHFDRYGRYEVAKQMRQRFDQPKSRPVTEEGAGASGDAGGDDSPDDDERKPEGE